MKTYEVYAAINEDSTLDQAWYGGECNCMISRNQLRDLTIEDALLLWAFCIEKYPKANLCIAPMKS